MKNPSLAFCYRNERLRPVHGCSKVPTEGSARVKARDKEKTTLYCVDLKKREYSNYKKNMNSNTKSFFFLCPGKQEKTVAGKLTLGTGKDPLQLEKKKEKNVVVKKPSHTQYLNTSTLKGIELTQKEISFQALERPWFSPWHHKKR